jgi:hypothetical protein
MTTTEATPTPSAHKDKALAVNKLPMLMKSMLPPRAPKAGQKVTKPQDPVLSLSRFSAVIDLLVSHSTSWSEEFNELLSSAKDAYKVISL